jgi:hypothetical protein
VRPPVDLDNATRQERQQSLGSVLPRKADDLEVVTGCAVPHATAAGTLAVVWSVMVGRK